MDLIDRVFTQAHTHYAWTPEDISEQQLRALFELVRWPPTGGNAQPLRIVFVRSAEAKERLRAGLAPGNIEKAMTAPVTAILAYDAAWYERLPRLLPSRPENRDRIAAMPAAERDGLATLNATLQAGYFILAARALGLDCGPMGGFDRGKVDAAFFPDGEWRSLLLVNLGHGDPARGFPRQPRLEFAEACRIE
ncbi:MAG: malonic semialdehyde reductase [Deltaproteobacteria bacterium]|nr:malonic semialdehyde reductase [Deltaproteobacteria bacterium]